MQQRQLGPDGPSIPAIGLGGMGLSGDARAQIDQALAKHPLAGDRYHGPAFELVNR